MKGHIEGLRRDVTGKVVLLHHSMMMIKDNERDFLLNLIEKGDLFYYH